MAREELDGTGRTIIKRLLVNNYICKFKQIAIFSVYVN
jgi:hypothetical protein